ncbi:hypothetical protein HK101_003331 [Irineochytrium annulatum]|nr:hypothetical protein HK101_003331 [Irineochytrium annulatum]
MTRDGVEDGADNEDMSDEMNVRPSRDGFDSSIAIATVFCQCSMDDGRADAGGGGVGAGLGGGFTGGMRTSVGASKIGALARKATLRAEEPLAEREMARGRESSSEESLAGVVALNFPVEADLDSILWRPWRDDERERVI